MMAAISGAKTNGVRGAPAPPSQKIPVFHYQTNGICSKIMPVLTQTRLFIF
jgi:hypothetical protein